MNRKWDSTDEESRRRCIEAVIARVDEVGDEGAGVIAAQDIIDIVAEHLGPEIYNRGVRDAKEIMMAKIGDLEYELDELEVQK